MCKFAALEPERQKKTSEKTAIKVIKEEIKNSLELV